MEDLDKKYIKQLDEIADSIQQSEHLEAYLNSEEEDGGEPYFLELQKEFEPRIDEIYREVANLHPMQLLDLENRLMDERFEGLYMPRILAYSVLRGIVDDKIKYIKPQSHFRTVLLALSHSPNFEFLTHRIGQSIQVGFALSSDIWINNLLNEIGNKRVRIFFNSMRIRKYRDVEERLKGLVSMRHQFKGVNFYTAYFPQEEVELRTWYPEVKEFLMQRVILGSDNSNLGDTISTFSAKKEFWTHWEFVYLFGLIINYFDGDDKVKKVLTTTLNSCRKQSDFFVDVYFDFLKELLSSKRLQVFSECNKRVFELKESSIKDKFNAYYDLMDLINSEGYESEETLAKVQKFYFMNEGLSTINECLRFNMLSHFKNELEGLDAEDYPTYMELYKNMAQYVNIFNNQQFNQAIGNITLNYLKKLLKHFTDKRSREYQDIKKFVSAAFRDLQFMSDKEIANLFKSKRKITPKK